MPIGAPINAIMQGGIADPTCFVFPPQLCNTMMPANAAGGLTVIFLPAKVAGTLAAGAPTSTCKPFPPDSPALLMLARVCVPYVHCFRDGTVAVGDQGDPAVGHPPPTPEKGKRPPASLGHCCGFCGWALLYVRPVSGVFLAIIYIEYRTLELYDDLLMVWILVLWQWCGENHASCGNPKIKGSRALRRRPRAIGQ